MITKFIYFTKWVYNILQHKRSYKVVVFHCLEWVDRVETARNGKKGFCAIFKFIL